MSGKGTRNTNPADTGKTGSGKYIWIAATAGLVLLAVIIYLVIGADSARRTVPVADYDGTEAVQEMDAGEMRQPAPPTGPAGFLEAPSPDFSLSTPDGTLFSLSEKRGKVVMLNFWATWCPPCKREIPDFIELQKKYGAKGLLIVGIALDKPESVMAFLREQPLNYTVLLGNNEVSATFGNIESIPTTFLIDREGIVRAVKVGLETKEEWEASIRKLL